MFEGLAAGLRFVGKCKGETGGPLLASACIEKLVQNCFVMAKD